MPRLGEAVYAAHLDNVLKLAKQEGGVSRPEIIEKLNVTRAMANGLIEKAELALDRKEGRTEYFVAPSTNGNGTTKLETPEVKETTVPKSDATGESDDDTIAELDAQIVDTRQALRSAAEKAGKALGDYATHQALVDALRERMTELAKKRMAASS